ncbi:hypothetical protein F6B41_04305 [Microbacterium lushaniae]|nr:hypothetical protein F6B41_04305 [Microbacterium lushaniae]
MKTPGFSATRAGALLGALTLVATLLTTPAAQAAGVEIEILSGRADSVSGGNALVSITGAGDGARITAAGVDVTEGFAPRAGALVGLVEDLPLGVSEIEVFESGADVASLEVVNHPLTGPVFSGPQHPMYCTASGAPWNLGALDADCHAQAAVVTYRYRTTAGGFADYPADGTRPADLAAATVEGVQVPYIVRIERGTINRAVYEVALLHEPGAPLPTPWADAPGWNRKLAYTFGGACGVGYWQGTSTGGVENHSLLSRGYAVASSTLNVYATNCNDVTSAETAMMVKEHVIEAYGPVRFTMGSGGSAGTMQQLLLSNNYPGILDGVLGEIGYPDERSTTQAGHDCRGLQNFWGSPAGAGWTDAQKTAVTGQAVPFTCVGFTFFDGVDDPNRGCAPAIPAGDRWSPTNPDGLRCTISDMVQNVYGTDEEGRGLRAIPDNVGLQYGLGALENGDIDVEQFLALNENIGGMDVDGNRTPERSEASLAAIRRAYETGRINMMTGGLDHIPVLEIRGYSDPRGDFHERYRSAIIRERMLAAHGDAGTHVNWTSPEGAVNNSMREEAIDYLDDWLEAIEAAGGAADRARTVAARPDGLVDGCFDTSGAFIAETLDYDDPSSTCNTLYPYHSEPRAVAGEGLMRDVLKCELAAPVRADYPVLTDAQWDRLRAAFPEGVCDWTKPGQGAAELVGTWLDYGDTTPVQLDGPAITGDAQVGASLSATAASATPGAELTYQWLADGQPISGAVSASLEVAPSLLGSQLTVRVTASADGFVTRTAVSAASAAVRDAPGPTPTPTPDPTGSPDPSDPDDSWAVVRVSPRTVEQGGSVSVEVTGLREGQTIGATVFSDPIVVAGIPAADGTGRTSFTVRIPADFALGAHTLEVTSAGETPIRVGLTVVAAGSLAATGAQVPWMLAFLAAFLCVAGGLLTVLRRRPVGSRA